MQAYKDLCGATISPKGYILYLDLIKRAKSAFRRIQTAHCQHISGTFMSHDPFHIEGEKRLHTILVNECLSLQSKNIKDLNHSHIGPGLVLKGACVNRFGRQILGRHGRFQIFKKNVFAMLVPLTPLRIKLEPWI